MPFAFDLEQLIFLLAKLFILALIFFYFIYTLIFIRQINLMNKVLQTPIEIAISVLALIQTIAAALLFVVALIIL